jgi:predicted PurR-regulated permease PerM
MSLPTVEGTPLPRPIVVMVGLATVFVVVAGLRGLSEIIGPTFLALVLTIAAHPMRRWVAGHGLPGWVGSVLAILVIYGGLVGLTLAMLVAGARFASLLPTYQQELQRLLDDALAWLDSVGVHQAQVDALSESLDLGRVVALLGDFVGGLVGVLTSLLFVVTLVLFMVVDATGFTPKLGELPAERRGLVDALLSFAVGTRKYLVVSTVFGLIVAVIDTAALFWIGVPVAVLWGLLAFITNYIPNIGFVIGVVPPAVIGLLEGGPGMMIAVLVTYSVINVVIQSVIQPKVVGDAVGLSTTITMLSLVFWAYTLGAVGAVMAVPLTLLAKAVLVDADPGSRWVGFLLAGPAPRPRAHPAPAPVAGNGPEPATDGGGGAGPVQAPGV